MHSSSEPAAQQRSKPHLPVKRLVLGAVILAGGIALTATISGIDAHSSGEWAMNRSFLPWREGWLNGITRVLEFIDGPIVIPWVLAAFVVIGLLTHRGLAGTLLMLVTGLAWFPGHIAKQLVVRNRPDQMDPIVVYNDTMSFPSGHTGMAAAMAFGLILVWSWHGHRVRPWMIGLGIFWVVLVGASRIYAGAHYPLDVLGGFLLAFGTSLLLSAPATWLFEYGQKHWRWLASPGVEERKARRDAELAAEGAAPAHG